MRPHDTAKQPADRVHNRHRHKVVFLEVKSHIVYRRIGFHGYGILLHHMLDFGNGRVGDKFLQWQYAAQTVVIVHHIYVVNLIDILCLHPHLLDAFGHTPVLVYHNHLGAHETTGGIFVVFQKVDDVASLFHIVDVRQDFITVLLIEFLDYIHSIVGVEVVDKLLGNLLGRHGGEELATVVLVQLHEHVGGYIAVEQLVQKFRFVKVEFLIKLGNVRRVKVGKLLACGFLVARLYYGAYMMQVFRCIFFHFG